MKHLKIFCMLTGGIILIAFTAFSGTFQLNEGEMDRCIYVNDRPVIPDVMGFYQVAEADGEIAKLYFGSRDSLSLFPGFPLQAAGSSFEGGIFCNMDEDDDMEIVYCTTYIMSAWNLDGSAVPGWPQSISYGFQGAPAYGDIDGDGEPELVAGSIWTMTSGMIHAYELDGSIVTGFPINHGYSSRSVVLADLDGDNDMEIITNKRMWPLGEAWVYDGDGSVYPGWPQPLGHVPASSAGVGDITGDGIPEIAVESYDALYVYDINGNTLPGFPFYMPNSAVTSYSSPVMVDLDDDGFREIVFGTHVTGGGGYVFILRNDGSNFPGWPKYTNYWIYGPPAVGYIDDDDILDIAVGDQVLSPSPVDQVYAWNANGVALAGFPISGLNAINNQVALGDLDGDGMTELLIDDNTTTASGRGRYVAFNHDGSLMEGFPVAVTGTSFFNMPCLMDFNNDGILDILGAAKEGFADPLTNVYLWATGTGYSAEDITIPCFQYNVRHDGLYPTEVYVPPVPGIEVSMDSLYFPETLVGDTSSIAFMIYSVGDTDLVIDNPAWLSDAFFTEWEAGNTTIPAGDSLEVEVFFAPPDALDYIMTEILTSNAEDINIYMEGIGLPAAGVADKDNPLPGEFALLGAFPNPFNPTTAISYRLSANSSVKLTVFDIAGREIATLMDGYQNAGNYELIWDAEGMASGVYLIQLTVEGGQSMVQKVVLMK